VTIPAGRSDGFTLLEILVALVVFGILMLGLTHGVQFGMAAWNRQTATIASATDIEAADRALRRLIAQMDPGTAQAPPLAIGTAGSFAFTSTLPMAAALPTRRADMRLDMQGGRLLLHWTVHLHAQRIGPAPQPQMEELLTGVQHLSISYWPRPPEAAWQSAWTSPGLPALVRIHLDLAGRHWPDIIAAPAATQPDTPGDVSPCRTQSGDSRTC
jgi:general secretion pathway protein J